MKTRLLRRLRMEAEGRYEILPHKNGWRVSVGCTDTGITYPELVFAVRARKRLIEEDVRLHAIILRSNKRYGK